MKENRIYFKDNPWPEGHLIKEFIWSARIENGDVWFDMQIITDDYYSERDVPFNESDNNLPDWQAPDCWSNYHSCRISSNFWHQGGFRVCSAAQYSAEFLDGFEINVDSNPEEISDWDDFAFFIYLLGHDAVAMHQLRFERIGVSDQFNIDWSGKIALAYAGDYEFKYDFSTKITGVAFPTI